MGREQRKGGRFLRRRGSGDRGSALLESAIVLPFLAVMVFGIVELGFLFRSAVIVNTATRSGARLAASQYGSATNNPGRLNVMNNVAATVEKDLSSRASVDTPDQLWIYKANASGFPGTSSNFSACAAPCFIYQWDPGTKTFVYQSGSWSTPNTCGTTHDSVGVYVRVSHAPIGFTNFLGTLTVNEKTVMRLEPPTPNNCPFGF